MPSDAEVKALAEAMWQILDDMRMDGYCCCGIAKARARIAYEPFRGLIDDDGECLMPLDAA